MIKNIFYVAMATFALNYIFLLSLFLHYCKFPVSISSGVALWVKKIKTIQTDGEFKRSSTSPEQVLRVIAAGKFTLLLPLKPVQSESPFGISLCLFGAESGDFALSCLYPWSVSLEIHINIALKSLAHHLCSISHTDIACSISCS